MLKNVRMHTVRLSMCSTVAPMARAGGGDITGNVLGQGFTSPSPCTHVQDAYGAPTGAVGGAANGRQSVRRMYLLCESANESSDRVWMGGMRRCVCYHPSIRRQHTVPRRAAGGTCANHTDGHRERVEKVPAVPLS